jgi:hypothetical protein
MLSKNIRKSFSFTQLLHLSLLLSLILASFPILVWGQDPLPEMPERPDTEELLPETTVAMIQVDNIREFLEKIRESGVGQMMQDESVAPLVERLWGEAQSAYAEQETEIGVSLEDLQTFPAGEITFAVIAPRRKSPEYMMIIETDPESEAVDRIFDRGREVADENGIELISEEGVDGITFETFTVNNRLVKLFRHEGLMVASTSDEELDHFIDRWMGREVEKVRPLSQNRKFITIMNRCKGTGDLIPAARFYVDPIEIVRSSTRGNAAAQVTLAFLPVLGLDGLLGIGGSMLLGEDEFASMAHGHVLLAEPRKGVFEMFAFKPTHYDPEPWMPRDVHNYFTTSWDVDQMFAELSKIIDTFQGEDKTTEFVETTLNPQLGFDVREEILGNLTGRVTWAQWNEPPMRVNSSVNLLVFEVKDPVAFEETMEKIVDRANRDQKEDADGRVEAEDYNGIRIFGPSPERMAEQFEQRRERRRLRREERGQDPRFDVEVNPPTPSVALVGNYLIVSPQSRVFLRHAIDTDQGEFDSLAASEDYERVSTKMVKMLKTDMPSGIAYSDPRLVFRWMFELAMSENSQSFLADQAIDNPYVSGIKQAIDEHPLPEFDQLEQYLQPQGGFMTSDETGLHFLMFELRSED